MGIFSNITNPYEIIDDDHKPLWEIEEEKKQAKYIDEELDFDEIMEKYHLSIGDLAQILDRSGNWRYGSGATHEIIGRLREAIENKEKDVYSRYNEVRLQTATGNKKLKLKGVSDETS